MVERITMFFRMIAISSCIALFPLLLGYLAGGIADILDCPIADGVIDQCLVGPLDLSTVLNVMLLSLWLLILTFPLGAFGVAFSLGYVVFDFLRREKA
ncbi:hypothetical protein FCL40_04270 [Ferrimonas sediminicola]|uniref:Uncharacterized protein n=1 Tax=Ferrimonas sediminicola TaxID=2569538 RepID=A0A4U1BHX7_9GAMM|nr:hypothetical protein [Ferrimonas sediminicola]TKB50376.1 hypothetical protein FCL40_04270 [Ferrimonas sediminicola]